MSDSSIQVEPIDGPDGVVPVDGLAAHLTDSVGLPDDAGPGDMVPDHLADLTEEYDQHAAQRDEHLSDEGGQAEQVEQGPQGKQQQRVPLGALQEERRARQAAQEQARDLQARLNQVLQLQQAAQQQQLAAQQQAEIPAFVDDPEGHVAALTKQFEQRLNDLQGVNQQRQQFEQAAIRVQHELAQAAPIVTQLEAEFTARCPDYGQAYAHLDAEVNARIAQQHPGATPEQHAFAKQVAMLAFVKDSHAKGLNPAQLIYDKARELGYQAQHRAPQGQMPKKAPTSLSTLPSSGRAPDERGALSASQIASMSNQEFDEMFERMRADDAPRFGF